MDRYFLEKEAVQIANKHETRCSVSLSIREIRIILPQLD
jgi:hypothetical protein